MTLDLRKTLLAGTAIVAVGTFAPAVFAPAHAANEFTIDEDDDGTVETSRNTGDSDNFDGHIVQFNGNAASLAVADGETIGNSAQGTNAVVGSTSGNDATGDALTIVNDVNDATASITVDGNIDDGDTDDIDVNFNAFTENGSDADESLTVDVNGDINLGAGILTLNSNDAQNDSQANTVTVSVQGDITANGGIVLNTDATGGQGAATDATLTLDGASAQTITGAIDGGNANEGRVNVTNTNSSGVTFAGAIGGTAVDSVVVNNDSNDQAVTFQGDVTTNSGLTLGGGATADTITATFDNSGGDTTITGAIAGAAAGDTVALVVSGGNRTTQATASTSELDTLSVSGTSTIFDSGANLTVNEITIGSGATLDTGAGTVTAAGGISLSGTLLATGGDIAADVTGASGTLDVDADATVTGSVTNLDAIDVADNVTLTIDATGGNETVSADSILINDSGTDDGITLATQGNQITVSNAVTTATDGNGRLLIEDAGTAVFSADIGASGTSVGLLDTTNGEDSAISAAGNVFVDDIDLEDESTLTLTGANKTVEGTIDGGAAGEGNVVVADGATTTFSSAIGGGAAVDLVQVVGTANVSKDITGRGAAAAATIDIDGTLNVDTDDNTVSITDDGTAAADIDIDGTVNFTGANDATLDAANAAGTLLVDGTLSNRLDSTKSLALNAGGGVTFAGTSETTFTMGQKTTSTDAVTFGAAGIVTNLNILASTQFDPTDADGDGTANEAADDRVFDITGNGTITGQVKVKLLGAANLDNNDDIIVLKTGGGDDLSAAIVTDAANLVDGKILLVDTALVDLQDNGSDATTLTARVVFKSTADVLTGGNNANAANSIINIAGSAGELADIRSALLTAENAADADEVIEAAQPVVDGGTVAAAVNISNSTSTITTTRLASLRGGEAVSGMTTGNMSEGLRVWMQGFGSTAEQDVRDGIDGYEADSYGVAVGMDTENAFNDTVVGLGLSYADTEVDSDAANNASTEIDSYQISVYGDHDLDDRTYLNMLAAYSHHENDTTRTPIAGVTANGEFDADQYTLRGEVGRDYQHNNTTLTPSLMAHWTHYDADDYTETGAGTANLTVDSEAINIFELGVGLAAGWEHQNRDGSIVEPELRVGYRYDFVGDEIETSSTFQGGGAAFKSTGADPAQSTFNAGAAVKYYTVDNWEFTANYDFEIKEDFDSHAGFVRAGYKF